MPYEKLTELQGQLIVGTKQTIKALMHQEVSLIYVAEDADAKLTEEVIRIAKENDVVCETVDSKKRLGQACGIDVAATTVAVKKG